MIKFKTKQTNSIVISTQPEVQQQTYRHQTQGVYGVDCGICGVRAKDPDDF